ncbi:Ribonuclease H-like domain [Lasallia pustulata]|uniref:Ribonuclease H-like domain n=1 Tax=Lasallia pustulata TaxID=136370 RepID=A0A1W5DEU7_9LECA|nr:Ribonuclease H-like domain [Lasallia pustulata]
MDFVVGLPLVNGYDSVCVSVDRLTKERHLTACHSTITSEGLADLFIHNIFRLHGLPDSVTSGRGPQFIGAAWKRICKKLGIKVQQSTAFHTETDGQTEKINGVIEQYLRAFVSYQQDDWPSWLPVAEFVGNNTVSEATKVTPFFANKGYHPRMGFEKIPATRVPQELKTNEFTTRMKELKEFLKTEMRFAQAKYETATNRHCIPAPLYQKLDMHRAGPFKVKRIINPYAYELDLPRAYGVHPVFHVNLLDPVATDSLEGHWQEPPPPILIDGEEEWLVEEILDSQKIRGSLNYLVKWIGSDNPTCNRLPTLPTL